MANRRNGKRPEHTPDIFIKNPPVNIPQLIYTLRKFEETDENIKGICDILEYQEQRISVLYEILYKLAPELEIIETMAETEEEEQTYIDKYMNHGNYLEE